MRFTKDDALMLETIKWRKTRKSKKTMLPNGGWWEIDGFHTKKWYNDRGELHRLDGPATENERGSKCWCQDGKLHRLDGPAIDGAGDKYWYVNDKKHRLDGPAVEWASGHKEWWVNDKEYTEEEFNKLFGKYKDLADKEVVADMEGMFE